MGASQVVAACSANMADEGSEEESGRCARGRAQGQGGQQPPKVKALAALSCTPEVPPAYTELHCVRVPIKRHRARPKVGSPRRLACVSHRAHQAAQSLPPGSPRMSAKARSIRCMPKNRGVLRRIGAGGRTEWGRAWASCSTRGRANKGSKDKGVLRHKGGRKGASRSPCRVL